MTAEITSMGITELAAAYRAGELSPVDAVSACLARIEERDRELNAFCLLDGDRALEDAARAERRLRAGEALGVLDGVPVAIKDVFLTSGWATLRGSRAVPADGEWVEDAPAVAALRRHGAVPLGKTTTPELGWKAVTDSPLTGVTRNPWERSRTPGGSSGGSAAALAAGMAPLALGTDGGGSIRIPSSFCGVAGLKPTFGCVPAWPASPFGTLAHSGPMARSVMDLAVALDAIAEQDRRDWTALPPSGGSFAEQLAGGIEGKRVALSVDLGYVDVEEEVRTAVERAAVVFQQLGADVESVTPGFADPRPAFDVLWTSGAAMAVRKLGDGAAGVIDPGLAEIAKEGSGHSALEYLQASAERDELGLKMSIFHSDWDLLLTPTVPIAAFAAGQEVPTGWPERRWPSWTPFTYPFNLTQQPAASVPCGMTSEGLPIGLQIVGGRYRDDLVLRAAAAYEAASPWPLTAPLA